MFSTVSWIVDQLPPSTPDEEVEAEFRARCTDARNRGHDIEPEREEKLVSDAVEMHRRNRRIHEFQVWALRD